jgi:hypothetical protein
MAIQKRSLSILTSVLMQHFERSAHAGLIRDKLVS